MSQLNRPLDPRAWLLWLVAASLPALVGRNPFTLLAVLLTVLGVRSVWGTTPRFASWQAVVRLALVFAAVSVLFNVLTVHVGDRVIVTLPDQIPLIGGILTLNALVYGLLSGLALLVLVLIGTTVAAVLDWMALLRLLPARLATLAVASSVAWTLMPRMLVAFTEIREAQAARGHQPRRLRDAVPLLTPLLAGGLERSFQLAEALEARGFGAHAVPGAWSWRQGTVTVVALTAAVTGAYLLAVGQAGPAVALLLGGGLLVLIGLRTAGPTPPCPDALGTGSRSGPRPEWTVGASPPPPSWRSKSWSWRSIRPRSPSIPTLC